MELGISKLVCQWAQYCDHRICMSVCPSVCLHVSETRVQVFCMCYLRLWHGLPLTTIQ